MSGFLSLWAIVDKEEIAAINGAALQDAVLRKVALRGSRSPSDQLQVDLGYYLRFYAFLVWPKPRRGRTVCRTFEHIMQASHTNQRENYVGRTNRIYSTIV